MGKALDLFDRRPVRVWLGCVALPVFLLLSSVACYGWLTDPQWPEEARDGE